MKYLWTFIPLFFILSCSSDQEKEVEQLEPNIIEIPVSTVNYDSMDKWQQNHTCGAFARVISFSHVG